MADWKTYAKAARNTARRQAPEAKQAAQRATDRAGGYARAAGKAIDGGLRGEGTLARRDSRDELRSAPDGRRGASPQDTTGPATATTPRSRSVDSERLVKDAAAYYTVASRRVATANPVPRILRALRDALLIGISLVAIWGVLAAAGIPIPFTTVLIVVGVVVAASFGTGVYAQWKRAQDALETAEDPRDR